MSRLNLNGWLLALSLLLLPWSAHSNDKPLFTWSLHGLLETCSNMLAHLGSGKSQFPALTQEDLAFWQAIQQASQRNRKIPAFVSPGRVARMLGRSAVQVGMSAITWKQIPDSLFKLKHPPHPLNQDDNLSERSEWGWQAAHQQSRQLVGEVDFTSYAIVDSEPRGEVYVDNVRHFLVRTTKGFWLMAEPFNFGPEPHILRFASTQERGAFIHSANDAKLISHYGLGLPYYGIQEVSKGVWVILTGIPQAGAMWPDKANPLSVEKLYVHMEDIRRTFNLAGINLSQQTFYDLYQTNSNDMLVMPTAFGSLARSQAVFRTTDFFSRLARLGVNVDQPVSYSDIALGDDVVFVARCLIRLDHWQSRQAMLELAAYIHKKNPHLYLRVLEHMRNTKLGAEDNELEQALVGQYRSLGGSYAPAFGPRLLTVNARNVVDVAETNSEILSPGHRVALFIEQSEEHVLVPNRVPIDRIFLAEVTRVFPGRLEQSILTLYPEYETTLVELLLLTGDGQEGQRVVLTKNQMASYAVRLADADTWAQYVSLMRRGQRKAMLFQEIADAADTRVSAAREYTENGINRRNYDRSVDPLPALLTTDVTILQSWLQLMGNKEHIAQAVNSLDREYIVLVGNHHSVIVVNKQGDRVIGRKHFSNGAAPVVVAISRGHALLRFSKKGEGAVTEFAVLRLADANLVKIESARGPRSVERFTLPGEQQARAAFFSGLDDELYLVGQRSIQRIDLQNGLYSGQPLQDAIYGADSAMLSGYSINTAIMLWDNSTIVIAFRGIGNERLVAVNAVQHRFIGAVNSGQAKIRELLAAQHGFITVGETSTGNAARAWGFNN